FYNFSDWLIAKLTSLIQSFGLAEGNLLDTGIRKGVREIFLGMMMLGYIRLAGYIVYVPNTWNISAPTTNNIRKVFLYFLICLAVAAFAAVAFLVANNLLLRFW